MSNSTIHPLSCNPPFLPESAYPSTGGDLAARFCATLAPTTHGAAPLSCCLPCPATSYLFSDAYPSRVRLASYISIGSLVCNTFLLVTFFVLPREKSHRHYLSVGLTVSLILIAVAFIIPLGTKPDLCYNDITPHNERTQASCGATGVLVELGAMGAVVWILLRSLWTTLRITIPLKHPALFQNISIALGISLPILFMSISVPITSVSYSIGNVCVPSHTNAFQTYFVWILIFTVVSWIVQVATILYCLWRFASFTFTDPESPTPTTASSSSADPDDDIEGAPKKEPSSPRQHRTILWTRARSILTLQWRSIALAFIIANLVLYFGMFFIQQTNTSRVQYAPGAPALGPDEQNFDWVACLMANADGREGVARCLHGASGFGLREIRVEATLIIASLIGIVVFLLMVRTSMFIGWYELLLHPRQAFRRPSVNAEVEHESTGRADDHEQNERPASTAEERGPHRGHGSDDIDGIAGHGGSEKSRHSSTDDGLKGKGWGDDDEADEVYDEDAGVGGPSKRWTGGPDGIGVAFGGGEAK